MLDGYSGGGFGEGVLVVAAKVQMFFHGLVILHVPRTFGLT